MVAIAGSYSLFFSAPANGPSDQSNANLLTALDLWRSPFDANKATGKSAAATKEPEETADLSTAPATSDRSTEAGDSPKEESPSSPNSKSLLDKNELAAEAQPGERELTAAELVELEEVMNEARAALRRHDFEGVDAHIAHARTLAPQGEWTEAVEGLGRLTNHARDYSIAIRKAVSSLQAGSEINVGDGLVVAVEVSDERIVVHASGENRRFA